MVYIFTNDLFGNCEIKNFIDEYILHEERRWKILEIGSFEGSSSTYFSDNMLHHPDSSLTCVDPFTSENPTNPYRLTEDETKDRFLANISKSKNFNKITLKQVYSNTFFETNTEKFNFIYIDGSHLAEDVAHDFKEAIKICESGGYIAMDDYMCADDDHLVKKYTDKIYDENKDKLKLIGDGWQILFYMK
jgi:predicted O-methyltransferase YrrM